MIPAAMILGALMTAPAQKPEPVGTVLFVCEHGSAKSVVAAAHFNRIAADRGLPFRAISRGTVPDPEMAPAAIQSLLADGLKPDDPTPAKLEQSDLAAAVRVVTFCDLPPELKVAIPIERWEVPPVSTEYTRSRDAMLEHIDQLLLELADPHQASPEQVPPGPVPKPLIGPAGDGAQYCASLMSRSCTSSLSRPAQFF